VQVYPDQPTEAIGNCADGLIVSQAAIHDLEDASFRPDRSVGALIENAPHLAVALGGAAAREYSRALVISRAVQALTASHNCACVARNFLSQSGTRRGVGFPVGQRLQHTPCTPTKQMRDQVVGYFDLMFLNIW
jgi:hypothetical protein